MNKFPSIKQFRDVVRFVKQKASFMGLDAAGAAIINHAPTFPKLTFRGSIKLHGTNAGIVLSPESIEFQSRERVLTHTEDNAGFYNHMLLKQDILREIESKIIAQLELDPEAQHQVTLFGEWCGGNIQRGVALNGLPKMFVVFAISLNDAWANIDDFAWLTDSAAGIYNINQFPQYEIEIDFERPEIAQNALAALTEQVEARCPVGASFGNIGTGEGIVWRCVEHPSSDYWFKVKGEKHSASTVKTLAAVDVEAVEKIRDFVAMAVTPARLEQGLQNLVNEQLKPFTMESMGDFIRWVYNDVFKEEGDTIAASGFDPKKLGGPLANASRKWFVEKLNSAA